MGKPKILPKARAEFVKFQMQSPFNHCTDALGREAEAVKATGTQMARPREQPPSQREIDLWLCLTATSQDPSPGTQRSRSRALAGTDGHTQLSTTKPRRNLQTQCCKPASRQQPPRLRDTLRPRLGCIWDAQRHLVHSCGHTSTKTLREPKPALQAHTSFLSPSTAGSHRPRCAVGPWGGRKQKQHRCRQPATNRIHRRLCVIWSLIASGTRKGIRERETPNPDPYKRGNTVFTHSLGSS